MKEMAQEKEKERKGKQYRLRTVTKARVSIWVLAAISLYTTFLFGGVKLSVRYMDLEGSSRTLDRPFQAKEQKERKKRRVSSVALN